MKKYSQEYKLFDMGSSYILSRDSAFSYGVPAFSQGVLHSPTFSCILTGVPTFSQGVPAFSYGVPAFSQEFLIFSNRIIIIVTYAQLKLTPETLKP